MVLATPKAASLALTAWLLALSGCDVSTAPQPQQYQESIVVRWDGAALGAVRRTRLGPPMVARALAILHTAMYDAWAAYDATAVGTQLGGALRRPPGERTLANKEHAVSMAAYRALTDLFPSEQQIFDDLMQQFGFNKADQSTVITTPVGIGNVAAAALISFRHDDGSNQLGDRAPGPYSDYTGYQPVNSSSQVTDPNRWQPLLVYNSSGDATTQQFVGPQWGLVKPFALTSGAQFRPLAVPNLYPSAGYEQQALELIEFSANLTDQRKAIVEYWADGPETELPPGHWALFAQWIARRDSHTLDEDVKMFFVLTNALLDVGIAVWD